MPKLEFEIEDFAKFLENPAVVQERQNRRNNVKKKFKHAVENVSRGHILGIAEAISGKNEVYSSSAIVISQTAEVLMIRKDEFIKHL